ncbi:hypothetical protein PMAYCL1PPCAC_21709 [Pristionchus mayeri]|uniref:acid phosphatase n=1 Tax=Pristionchus mayeri TaxID=1317129 RepID=A0AAN5CVT3_9BILA|nr:hypothetical protein PMAYCL1PPCAC_21709 [Pristionchus mayeri]
MKWLLLYSLPLALSSPINGDRELVFVQALWRHGQRAGNGADHLHDKHLFKYGMGELTEAGIDHTYNLGRWLRKRYVDEKQFLSSVMNPKELYIESVDVSRCLMCAQAVGQGMYNAEGRNPPLPVAVHSRPKKMDWMLSTFWANCPATGREITKICPDFPDITTLTNYNDYTAETFRCTNASQHATYFNTTEKHLLIDALIALEQAGAKLPHWYTHELRREAKEVFDKNARFQLGIGEFHNDNILRYTTGLLMDTLQNQMAHKWACTQGTANNCRDIRPIKFRAYSTQDWILNSLLESLGRGTRVVALDGHGAPQFNALVLIELWNIRGSPYVKLRYRPDAHTEAATVLTPNVRGCWHQYCSLDVFGSCCNNTTSNPQEACR